MKAYSDCLAYTSQTSDCENNMLKIKLRQT